MITLHLTYNIHISIPYKYKNKAAAAFMVANGLKIKIFYNILVLFYIFYQTRFRTMTGLIVAGKVAITKNADDLYDPF